MATSSHSSPQLQVLSPQGSQTILLSPDLRDARLTQLLRRAGLPLNTRCGQRALCDGCIVDLLSGELIHLPTGATLRADAASPRTVRACEYRVGPEGARITIPPRSLLAYEPLVVSDFKINVPFARDPLWQCVKLDAADLPPNQRTLDGVAAAIAQRLDLHHPPSIEPRVTAAFPHLPDCTFHVIAEYRGHDDDWSITDLSTTAPPAPLGVAIDVGTTTVVVLLVDLVTGKVLAQSAGFNRQIHLGDDVLTRINLCVTDKSMLPRLQQTVVHDSIQKLLHRALNEAGASETQITCLTVAANTTMLHLLAGVDPSSMGITPFTPTFVDYRALPASFVHLHLASPPSDRHDPVLHLLPSAAAYVGADLTAGILASGLVYDDGPSMLVDIGTNGEIILKHNHTLLGCATAAGPAFEGSRLACGMRAGAGAISHIRISTDPLEVQTDVIGNVHPTGICGSAYVDFLAQARRCGIISPTGRLDPAVAGDRLVRHARCGLSFRVATGHGNEPILISESDIASLLQAKAAIAAGILSLLARVNFTADQIKTLYLAGGFGMHTDIASAIACGLLPGFRPDQIQLVGNTALAGAYLALMDSGVMDEMTRIARSLQTIELNLEPDFESTYIDQLCLP